jgi:PhnB protein
MEKLGASAQLSVRRGRDAVDFYLAAFGAREVYRVGGVDDNEAVVATIDRAVGLGAREVYPAAEAHGWLLGRIEDPYGHHWEIGRPLVDWPPPRG